MPESELRRFMADILSVLALTMSEEGDRESLRFRLEGTVGDIGSWGHEYIRNLAGEMGNEFQRQEPVDDLMDLVKQIVPFHVKVDKLDMVIDHIDKANHKRTCSYLTSFASYVPEPDDMAVLKIAYQLYCKFNKFPEALRVALRMGNAQYVKATIAACKDPLEKQQICYILGRQGVSIELDGEMTDNEEQRELLQELVSNSKSSEGYLTLACDLDVMEPKNPDDLYKAYLVDGREPV